MSNDYETYESAVGSNVDLTAFDDDFDTVEAPAYDEVPDGKYQVRIDGARLETSQKGDPMIKWDLIIVSGPQKTRHIFKNSVITAAALSFVKGDLKTAGLTLTKFSDLAGRLEELLDVMLEITKRTKGEYSNVYFNRKIQLAAGVGDVDSDGTPF